MPITAVARTLTKVDRRGLQWAMQSPSAATHRRLATLSNLANHSKLWIGVAAIEAAVGGRAGRRAAARSMVSIAASSLIVNTGLKPLWPRSRPPLLEGLIPLVRRPLSSSFPSGHSASAVAFATATAMEAPLFAAPAAALAGAVSFSRAATGVHYPSDIVVGAGIGAAIATLSSRVWPRHDHEVATAAHRFVLHGMSVSDSSTVHLDGDGLVVVVNAAAGSGESDDEIDVILEALPATEIVRIEADDELEVVMSEVAARAEVFGVIGGDGTISTAARAAIDHRVPLAIFPGGTLNHFARDLGIDSIHDTMAALGAGTLTWVDTATIDGHLFINTASFGTYSDFVARREVLEPRIGKWAAMLMALVQVFVSGEPIDAEIDGRPMRVWMIFIGNGVYRPLGFVPSARARLDDGRLDLRVVDGAKRLARFRIMAALLTGRLDRSSIYHQRIVDHVSVETERDSLQLAADGEIFDGAGSFTVSKDAATLEVFVNDAASE